MIIEQNPNSTSFVLDLSANRLIAATQILSAGHDLWGLLGGGGSGGPETDPIFTAWAQTFSANYQSTFTTVSTQSANWNYQGLDLKALSARWDSSYTTVNSNSAVNWNYQGTDLKDLSANWQSTFTTVSTQSANWNYQGTDLKDLSANWQNTFTTVSAQSANWINVNPTLSFNENSAQLSISPGGSTVNLSALSGGGGGGGPESDPVFTTWAQAFSANYQSTFTTVSTQSARWDSAYTNTNSGSAVWERFAINFIIDGAGDYITTGNKGYVILPWNATIKAWVVTSLQTGNIAVDILSGTYADFSFTSIVDSQVPLLNGTQKNNNTNFFLSNTVIPAQTILLFSVSAYPTPTVNTITVTLTGTKYV